MYVLIGGCKHIDREWVLRIEGQHHYHHHHYHYHLPSLHWALFPQWVRICIIIAVVIITTVSSSCPLPVVGSIAWFRQISPNHVFLAFVLRTALSHLVQVKPTLLQLHFHSSHSSRWSLILGFCLKYKTKPKLKRERRRRKKNWLVRSRRKNITKKPASCDITFVIGHALRKCEICIYAKIIFGMSILKLYGQRSIISIFTQAALITSNRAFLSTI